MDWKSHRGHRTWHPVIFCYGDTLKTMPTNHHAPPKCARTARSHSSCGANYWWEHVEARLAGVRLSYWHLQSNEGRSHWAFLSWFLLVNKLGHLHYLCVKLYLILTINKYFIPNLNRSNLFERPCISHRRHHCFCVALYIYIYTATQKQCCFRCAGALRTAFPFVSCQGPVAGVSWTVMTPLAI